MDQPDIPMSQSSPDLTSLTVVLFQYCVHFVPYVVRRHFGRCYLGDRFLGNCCLSDRYLGDYFFVGIII